MDEFLAAADSIFSFIAATAEREGDGYRWKTYDYQDRPQYHYNIFNGVGGIPIFLLAYHRATKSKAALEYARGAVHWCINARPAVMRFQRGMQLGKVGVAFAALCFSEETGEDTFTEFWRTCAANLLSEPPGPITDFLSGESSNGWFLLKLWSKTKEDVYLQGAVRSAEWICQHLRRDARGTHCLVDPIHLRFDSTPYLGLSHGIAGVAYFLALLFEATQDERWFTAANEILQTVVQSAQPDRGGLNWPCRLGETELTRCQYSHGAPGIGLVLAQTARIFADDSLFAVALRAGEATYHYGDYRHNPTLCTGLAGGGELFVELYRHSKDLLWLRRAQEFAKLAAAYKARTGEQDYWPTDTPNLHSADFTYGAAGTGYFFLRVSTSLEYTAPLM